MKWLLIVLFLNIPNVGYEIHSHEFFSEKDCRQFALEINERMNYTNEEANRLGRLQIEQVYAWCEKK